MTDPRPIGVFDSGVGGLTVLREMRPPAARRIDDLPRRQRPGAVRDADRRRGPRVHPPGARSARRARRQGDGHRLQHVDRGRPDRPPPALSAADPRRDPARRRRGGPGDPGPPGRRDRHAGDRPLARLLPGDQGGEPGGRGVRARHAGVRADGRGRPPRRARGRGHRARLARGAPRRARRERRVRLPAPALGPDRHAPPRLHPLPAPPAGHPGGGRRRASRSSTRRRPPRPRSSTSSR